MLHIKFPLNLPTCSWKVDVKVSIPYLGMIVILVM